MIDRRSLLAATAAGAALAAGGRAFAAPQDASTSDPAVAAELNTWMDRTFERTLDASPEAVTGFGLDKGARAAAKSRMTIPTLAEEEASRQLTRDFRTELGRIDRSKLHGVDAIRHDTLTTYYDSVIATYDVPYGQGGWPSIYRVSQQSGTYQSAPDFLDNQHTIETAADADAYVARIAQLGDVLTAETERMQEDFARGVIPPDFILAKTIGQQEGMARIAPGQSPMTNSVVRRTAERGLTGDWGAQVERLLTERVYPALAAQTAALKAFQPRAGHDPAVSRLPQGEQFYANALRLMTTTDMTADQIHDVGLAQVAELTARADQVLRGQGMTQGTVAERITAIGEDPAQVYPDTDAAKLELIEHLNGQMAAMARKLPNAFGRLPRATVEIKRVPPEIQDGAALGYYNSPSLDGSRPGIYWINLKDTGNWPKWSLPTLTYHEASPGHHLQIALQQESPSAPMLMNTIFFSAHGEGWGLYAEQLADELGAYEGDPLGQVGYLQSLMFRAVRLVVDTGLHARGWSRERAIQYMVDTCGRAGDAATSEIDRYCGWPGQATSYKVGHNEWVRLRENARQTLGARFDIKGFHDTTLAAGGVPLSVLGRLVDDWVASQRG
ncbi:MAG: DUF885 domain-containing protein [Brevundimonas sp.]|uniref:DUF885 domain-containing protein n=1 Tax=Brevundimonas sp. TaxID=1871086 RepID=UPI0040344F16